MKILEKVNDKYLKVASSLVVSLMMIPSSASAAGTTKDAAAIASGLSAQIPIIAGLLVGFFALTGLFFVGSGVMKLVAKGNPQGGGQQITSGQIAIHIGAGTVLLTLAVIILIARNTLFGGNESGSNFNTTTQASL